MQENKGTILIVDDEQDILNILTYNIGKDGYNTITANNGNDAVLQAIKHKPDLILLDRLMPGKDGIATLKEIRKHKDLDNSIIIFLTALGDEKSEIEGLENGADDYISKPIKPELLLTRIHTAMRRFGISSENNEENLDTMSFGDLIIDKQSFLVKHKNESFNLAKKEFELLSLLASKPGRVFLRNEILQKVWGSDVIVGDRTIDVHIRKIRQKLDMDIITTVKGVGYKFQLPNKD